MNRLFFSLSALALLGGCAATQLDASVHTQGAWPSGRTPGAYAFQRLPSQQADAADQAMIEAAARPALQRAGFQPVDGGAPDVLVQLARRTAQAAGSTPWLADGFAPFGAGGYYGWRRGSGGWRGWRGWGYSAGSNAYAAVPNYFSEVAVLLLDARSQAALYESRAQADGIADLQTWAALFEAALKDFPFNAVSPRQVLVQLAPVAPPAAATK